MTHNERLEYYAQKRAKHQRIIELETWFTWYDTQTIQYQRDMRLDGKSSIDISKLDNEARAKAKEIKDLRLELEKLRK